MILVGNGKVITRDPTMPYIENGAVVTKDDSILEVGLYDALHEKYPEARFIDADGGIIMPGIINIHAHAYSAVWLGLSLEGNHHRNFKEVIEGTWWTKDRCLSLEGIRAYSSALMLDSIRNGVTTIFYNHASYAAVPDSLFTIKDVAEEMGIRCCLCLEVSERRGLMKCEEAIRENAEFAEWTKRNGYDMISSMFGVHTVSTISDETFRKIEKANHGMTGYHIHFSIDENEVMESLKKYGCRPVNRLLYNDILGEKTILANHLHMNQEESDLVKSTGTMAVTNPEAMIRRTGSCASVLKMLQSGITVGLGTDTYTHDLIENLKTFAVLEIKESLGQNMSLSEGMRMLFENNSVMASRFFSRKLGILKPGAAADIIIMDYMPYAPFSDENVDSHILYGMNGKCCKTTIVNGKILYENRKFVAVDEDEVNERILTQSRKFWVRMKNREYL